MKPDCYKCKYRGEIPGDAHSRCNHPKVHQSDNPFAAVAEMLMGKNNKAVRELGIEGNPIGIRRGWFMWPANFDPTWLVACNGFTAKPEPKEVTP